MIHNWFIFKIKAGARTKSANLNLAHCPVFFNIAEATNGFKAKMNKTSSRPEYDLRISRASGLSHFQRIVYKAVLRIPRGKITTYKILARHLKCRSCRAIGQALRRNPFAPGVPCHRVIASGLGPGGFKGQRDGIAIEQKLKLLGNEGVQFKNGKVSNPKMIHHFR